MFFVHPVKRPAKTIEENKRHKVKFFFIIRGFDKQKGKLRKNIGGLVRGYRLYGDDMEIAVPEGMHYFNVKLGEGQINLSSKNQN